MLKIPLLDVAHEWSNPTLQYEDAQDFVSD
jgi:hypothetical protein